MKTSTSKDKFSELRGRAQVFLTHQPDTPDLKPEEIKRLVHELNTYQIELEVQNEDLRHSQAELEESRQRYSDLYDFAPTGYLTVSNKGLILEANLKAAAMLGVERRFLFNQRLSAFILPEDADTYYLYSKGILQTKEERFCELRIRAKDGSFFHAQLNSNLVSNGDDSTGQFRTAITDISKLKTLEHKLIKSKEEWEKTFDTISDIITVQDKGMRIVRANKAAYDFFEMSAGTLEDKKCHEVFRGIKKACPSCPGLKSRESRKSYSEIIEHPTLEKIFRVSTSPMLDEDNRLQYIVHTAKDISEQKRLEEELFQSNKMTAMGTLAGGIAHDFNNILCGILGYAEIAKENIPADCEADQYIDGIIDGGQRAAALVRQILAFSRKGMQKLQPLKSHLVIMEALRLMRASLPTTINIEEDIDTQCGEVEADPAQIHQIVMNLCTNAFHAMENEKGTIIIKLERQEITATEIAGEPDVGAGPFVVLTISDTGCGMDKATIKRIFEPYFTTKDVGKGSGLGLAVIHGIVKIYGGFIRVASEPGQGSTFQVYIPALKKDPVIPEKIVKKAPVPTGTERVLVVDDEEMIAGLNKTVLERLGYTVTATTNSQKALELVTINPDQFDLIVSDQSMPNLSGAELARKVLKIKPTIPIILCTGYSSAVSEKEALAIGIRKYVLKPVDITTLAQIVRQVLDKG